MIETVSTDKLFRQLQNAITRKLRSVTHTDAIRLWEQDLRRHVLECLAQKAKSDTQVADMLKTIPLLDQAGGVKLSDLLEQMTTFTGQLQKSKCKYPVRLMQAIAIKPLNVQAALDHLNLCALEKLSAKQVFCATVLKAELLSATGSVQEAYGLLKPLINRKNQPLSLHFSCSMRFAKLSRTRNTAETESTLTEIIRQINTSKSATSMWRHELAECTHELATLLMQCGRHQEALLWVQRSLQTWQLLSQDQPDRIDVQLMHAASLRSLSVAQDELGETAASQSSMLQATHIVQKLLSEYPENDTLQSELPKSHDVLGDIHLGNLDLERALKEYSSSAAIGAHLQFRDPVNVRWKLEEIGSAIRIAQVMKKMGRTHDALTMLESYRPQLEALIKQDSENLEHRATTAQMRLLIGDLHWLRQDHSQAELAFREALVQLNYAINKDAHSTRWLLMHLMGLQRLAEYERSRGELDRAFEVLRKARDAISKAINTHVHVRKLRQFFVAINTRMSDCAFDNGKVSIGMEVQKQTLQQATEYQKEHPDSMPWLTLLCRIQTHASRHCLTLGLMQESRALWEPAISRLSQQCALHPENMEIADYLVQAQLLKVEWLCQLGNLEEAQRISLILITQIRVSQTNISDTETRQTLLCECLEHFSFCCHHLQKIDQELAALNELLRIRRGLLKAHPESVPLQTKYYELLMAMGRNALKTGLTQRCAELFQEALKGFNDLHEKHRSNTSYLLSIGDILIHLGQTYQHLNNAAATQLTLNKALQLAEWLTQEGRDSYVMQLAATKIIFAVSQSTAYESQKVDLLKLAEIQAKSLHQHSENPALTSLIRDISKKLAQA